MRSHRRVRTNEMFCQQLGHSTIYWFTRELYINGVQQPKSGSYMPALIVRCGCH